MFPNHRHRRLRKTESLRSLFQEYDLSVNDLMYPLFVTEGKNIKEPISSLPNCFRFSIDCLVKEVKELYSLGIKAIMLFAKIDDSHKDNSGKEAVNPKGLFPRAIREIKNAVPEMIVISDIALDPYSEFGHDGIVKDNDVDNDSTIEVLAKMALCHAEAGSDILAPSDMMDGRVKVIRENLETNNFKDTAIMSYAVKYASGFYGPFRDALDSAPGFGDKKTYQMSPYNKTEAIREAESDIQEGADIIMIKPAMSYLDIISNVKEKFNIPISAYQVSGEYAMILNAIEKGIMDENIIYESLISIKRAGANTIATYFAKKIAEDLNR